MDRKEQAVDLKHNGSNCAQAVLLAYKDILDLDEETLKQLGSGFGIGMGNMEATCGALVAVNIILGLKNDGSMATIKKSIELLNDLIKFFSLLKNCVKSFLTK